MLSLYLSGKYGEEVVVFQAIEDTNSVDSQDAEREGGEDLSSITSSWGAALMIPAMKNTQSRKGGGGQRSTCDHERCEIGE